MIPTADTKPWPWLSFIAPAFPFGEPVPGVAKCLDRHVKVFRRGIADAAVDADHLAAHVEQRSARIAAVEGAIGLQRVRCQPDDAAQTNYHWPFRIVTTRMAQRQDPVSQTSFGDGAHFSERPRALVGNLHHAGVLLVVCAECFSARGLAIGK